MHDMIRALDDERMALRAHIRELQKNHDARVTELLNANSREVKRRREAEKRVAELERAFNRMSHLFAHPDTIYAMIMMDQHIDDLHAHIRALKKEAKSERKVTDNALDNLEAATLRIKELEARLKTAGPQGREAW